MTIVGWLQIALVLALIVGLAHRLGGFIVALQYTTSRSLGIFGEPRVNVLELNLVVEKAFPKK